MVDPEGARDTPSQSEQQQVRQRHFLAFFFPFFFGKTKNIEE